MTTKKRKPKTTQTGDALSPIQKDPAYLKFLNDVGDRDGLEEITQWNMDDPRAARLNEYLNDSVFKGHSLKNLASDAGLSLPDMALLYREMILRKGVKAMFAHIPRILEDAAVEAQAGQDVCSICEKAGAISPSCLRCGGTGRVRTKADKDARNFVGEVAGLTGKTPLLQVNNDNRRQTVQIGGLDAFEEMVKRSDPWAKKTLPLPIEVTDAEFIANETLESDDDALD